MSGANTPMTPLLEVRDLVTTFHTDRGAVRAVNGISYRLDAGESMAIVGESGSGKSVSVLSLLGLIPSPPGRVERGKALLGGIDLLTLPRSELRKFCGTRVAMVFQDPMTSLNPVLSVGYQLGEMLRKHRGFSRTQARRRSIELLRMVGIPDPAERLRSYPHQSSGGQRQRIMLAMALSCEPSLLIADEPTTALDVTVQAQIVELIERLQEQLGTAIIWITHDLALVAGLVDRICVMYAGFIVEEAPVEVLFSEPRHPYTVGLLRSLPGWKSERRHRLPHIPGSPPDLRHLCKACPFAPRCQLAVERCLHENPPLLPAGPSHRSACWRLEELGSKEGNGAE